ncbi:MAG: type II secretion system protein GspE [Calditrichaeota bacterium]|nr:type II secretion system protein GspE [Calditrichota bacterium]
MARRRKLGEILIAQGLITKEQLDEGLAQQKQAKKKIGETLIDLGYLTETDVFSALGDQLGVPYVSLSFYSVDSSVINLISEQFARQYKVVPLFRIANSLTLGMVDPLNLAVIDQVVRATGLEVEPSICSQHDIDQAIDHYYGTTSALDEVVQVLGAEEKEEAVDTYSLAAQASDAPIVKLVNLMLAQAVKEKASDIHIEPEESLLRVRFRVDGIMREIYTQPKKLQGAIISRLKIMASLDIAERRVPQDGRIQMMVEGKPIDLRVSTLPTVYGENVVLRILDKSNLQVKLSNLGFGPKEDIIRGMLERPNGLILVTGPTGSGKTTTLYSALNEVSKMDVNTITLEDPIEYRLPLIRQSQVNVKAGMTFAAGLRSILRQDPDIVMVGEIRDAETAKIAVEAAMTGHLVLSTLHTNDAPGALPRLVDMGVEPFLVATATAGVLAQRLVRRICTNCKAGFEPPESTLKAVGLDGQAVALYKGEGCRACSGSGYKGRLGIYEVLAIDETIRDLVIGNASADKIRHAAREAGMLTLREDGIRKALEGLTTLDEVFRVTAAVEA